MRFRDRSGKRVPNCSAVAALELLRNEKARFAVRGRRGCLLLADLNR